MNKGSMTPAGVYINPGWKEYLSENRLWQGIPGIERTKNGRSFACWYSGGKTEEPGNVIILEKSDDGLNFTDGWVVVKHDDPEVRCFDQCVWIDPEGKLRLFWTQSHMYYDGRDGVWMAVCDDPDGDEPTFSDPRRIANGLMLNKPTVTKNGEWLMPCALWSTEFAKASEEPPELSYEMLANVYVSTDKGETFSWRGGVDMPERGFDEHMVVELDDGRLWMLTRTKYGIGQAFSSDGGKTWENAGNSGHTGPNSRFYVRRLKSGRILMVNHVNPTYLTDPKGWNTRNNLMAMLSEDDGKTWVGGLMLDTRNDVSYPDGTEDEDGRITIVYDFDRMGAREILTACFTEEDILEGTLVSEGSYLKRVINRAEGKKE
ncbi:MAG: glycoside hydrolase [Clostridia bacterium]|nr:glycoside hydrolase [Clostridia bacterium]